MQTLDTPPTDAPVQKTGYAGFGSFHSDDVEVLVRQDAASYVPPPLPFADPLLIPAAASSNGDDSGANTNSSSATTSSSQQAQERQQRQQQTVLLGSGLSREQLFLIDFASWTFINHGAFGGTCR